MESEMVSGGIGLVVEAKPGATGLGIRIIGLSSEGFEGRTISMDGGVLRQKMDDSGRWVTQLHYDRLASSLVAVWRPEGATRWVFLEPTVLQVVPTAIVGEGTHWQLSSATNSRVGDVTNAVGSLDASALLVAGDTLRVQYIPVREAVELSKSWVIALSKTSRTSQSGHVDRPAEATRLPAAFALGQNQPNPFDEHTTIHFELPVGAIVRLEVFDVQGRRVRVLADRYYEPGFHSVDWDKKTWTGSSAGPGVYICSIQAGPFRHRRKMLVLP